MADGPNYNELNDFGKCIIDRKLRNAPKEAQTPSMRDIGANYIDTALRPLRGSSESLELSVTTTNGGAITNASTKSNVQSITYSPEVAACIQEFKPNLPLTPNSVRAKPSPSK